MLRNLTIYRKGLILIAVPLLFQLAFIGIVARMQWDTTDAQDRTSHSKTVLLGGNAVMQDLVDSQAAVRGFVITQNPTFLEAYTHAKEEIGPDLEALRDLVRDNPAQVARVERLQEAGLQVIAWHTENARLVDEGHVDQAIARIETAEGKVRMDRVRQEMSRFLAEESRLDEVRTAALAQTRRRYQYLLIGGSVLAFGLTILLAAAFNRSIAGRLRVFMENTFRVPLNIALAKPMQGNDEIARLDRAFHRMAGDLRESRLAEQAMSERLSVALRSAHLGTWSWHIAESRVVWDEHMFALFGLKRGDFAGGVEDFFALIHPLDRDRVRADLTAVSERNEFSTQCRVVWPDDTQRVLTLRGQRYVENGEAVKLAGVCWDSTERAAVEHALEESQQRFRQLAENIDEIFWITSGDGRQIIYVSPAYERIFEQPAEQLYARPASWLDMIHRDDRERVMHEFFDLAPYGVFDSEYRIVRHDGDIRWIRARGASVMDAAGQPYRIVGVARDVTDRHYYEEELKDARLRAEEGSRAKSQFLAAMSHELRTPLHGVIGMLDLLVDTQLSRRQRRFLDACCTSARLLLELINDILDLSKIEAGKLSLDKHDFDPDQVVEDAIRLTALRAQERDLELVCWVDDGVCQSVQGDSTRLRQVLVNLLGNAVKFTPAGEITSSARLQSKDDKRAIIEFAVADSGIGIPANQMSRLFRTFSQVDVAGPRPGGSGLGLAISKSLVEAMGGKIGVESVEGVGSTFRFTVPFELARETTSRTLVPNALESLRTLVVSKKGGLRDALRKQLAAFKMPSELACSADEAQARLRKAAAVGEAFDLLVLDRTLGDADGLQFVRTLRQDAALNGLRVFLLTKMNDETEDFTGCDRRLDKPVCRSELLNAIVESFCPSSAELIASAAQATAQRTPLTSTFAGQVHLLLAEDNHINQLFAREVLKHAGVTCECVFNGAEAVEAVRVGRYDLILMDCHMPEMDGFEASRTIRQLEHSGVLATRTPIVALTANAVKGDRQRCLEAGMDDYLSKPFEQIDLVRVIDRVLNATGKFPAEAQDVASAAPAATDGVSADPIDVAALMSRCMGSVELAVSMLNEMEQGGPRQVEQIQEHAAAGDVGAAAEVAHALKGASAIIMAAPIRSVAAAIEAAGKADELDKVRALVGELKQAMERFVESADHVREEVAARSLTAQA